MRAILLLCVLLLAGCTRGHYRASADRETYPIIAERILAPEYALGPVAVEPHPQSRLSDPFCPDHPPKPPDDPAAALFMEYPGGIRGAKHWEKDGVTDQIEPVGWEQVLPVDEQGTIKLDQDKAVEVALLNSREYQTAIENLYLAALSLTLNRFEFDLQWFARNATTFTHFGSGGSPTETNTLSSNSNVGFSRNFAAGGQLLVEFANSFVFEFTGDTQQIRSNLAINLIQPLLRGAGRKVRLESLTQAERNVLYSVRDFARFRKQFWATTAVQSGGYLDLLLAIQTIRNNQENLKQQSETYRLYNELFQGGRASAVELDQFFQSLQAGRLSVIQAEVALQNSLDAFKLRIGLPPRLPLELDDLLLENFVLVDPALDKFRTDVETFQRERLAELDEPPSVAELQQHFDTLGEFAAQIPAALEQATSDLARWGEQLDSPAADDVQPEQRDQARRTYEVLTSQLPEIAQDLSDVRAAIVSHRGVVNEANRAASWEALTGNIKIVLALVDTVISIQTQSKIYLIKLPQVELDEADALCYAKENRLDLQNQLGIVTDAWRRVTVAANALQSQLDIVGGANLGTDPDHLEPFNFASEASQYSLGVQFDAPLNRMAERNAYRASLISYQRAKRDYMALSDQIEFQIRQDLRQLRQLQVSFEISRQQLLSAARQFENARITLLGPRDRRSANDTTTLNLLQALNALLNARNALAANYINYEQQRVQLLLDLEALQLDQRGFPTHESLRFADAAGPDGPASLEAATSDAAPSDDDRPIAQPAASAEPISGPELVQPVADE